MVVNKTRKILLIILVLLLVGCQNSSETQKESYFEVHFLSVGQADAILVACDDHYMMIDCGTKSKRLEIDLYLKEQGVDYFDYLVCTHPDSDHYGGFEGVLNNRKVGTIYCSTSGKDIDNIEFNKFSNEGKIKVPTIGKTLKLGPISIEVKKPTTFMLGSAFVEVLAVNIDENSKNDSSIVLMITYGNNKFLFTGDAEKKTEKYLVENKDIKCDVLKVAHHGSFTSSSDAFLQKADPKYAVLCVSEGNDPPYKEVLDRLDDREILYFRTDNGHIICKSNGKDIEFTDRNGNRLDY
ncbi:MAG: MBL fold metallo-hydrolase [Oceanobacillus sp.]|nr:MBL fold metallo-hydrolase [Oceanobacillus sp.]